MRLVAVKEDRSVSQLGRDQAIGQLHQSLQKLIGLYRQLLETVRQERDALLSVEIKAVQDATYAKEALIESIKQTEAGRMKILGDLALAWRKPLRELTLSNVIIVVQGEDLKAADQLRSDQNTLQMLMQRTSEQNANNREICERALSHLGVMKKNVLGEGAPRTDVYSPQGQRVNAPTQSRLISREA